MSQERPTVRPVTLARLVEVTHLCSVRPNLTETLEEELGVTRHRARETILEACRIGLLSEWDAAMDSLSYVSTELGDEFVGAVRNENWNHVSAILERGSPHYGAFLHHLKSGQVATLEEILIQLNDSEDTPYTYNQTSVEVIGDWGERLGVIQRNVFTENYYYVGNSQVPDDFVDVILSIFDEFEETAGVNLRQRYLSVPKLREHTCEKLGIRRHKFDDALVSLVQENVGKLELSGAPIDTGAKHAKRGIKEIALDEEEGLVSTSNSTDQVMAGVEQFDKQYYYLAVYDRDLEFTQNDARTDVHHQ